MPHHSPERDMEFAALLTAHQGLLVGYIYSLVHNFSDAEDLYQQTSLLLWNKFDEFETGTSFTSWACRTAQLTCCNFLKNKSRNRLQFGEELLKQLGEIPAQLPAGDESRRLALDACLGKLSASDRRLVELCYGEKHSIKAAAEVLQRPLGAVYKSIARVRGALHACVERSLGRESDA